MGGSSFWVLGAAIVVLGCGRRDQAGHSAGPVDAQEARATTTGTSETWKVWRGRVPFLIVGKSQVQRGSISDVRGDLQIDFSNLGKTRGTVSADLGSLRMTTFLDEGQNQKQTADALRWLQVAESEGHRSATFTIRDIRAAEPNDLTTVAGPVRKSRVTVAGDLSFHGHKTDCVALLEITAAFEGPTPRNITLRTVDDLHLSLDAHDVRPRDERGKVLAKLSEVFADKLADKIDVALELAIQPAQN